MFDNSEECVFRGGCFCDVYFCPGVRGVGPVGAIGGLMGSSLQQEEEWIISNTAETNSTNLSFSSLGSRFTLSERERGGGGVRNFSLLINGRDVRAQGRADDARDAVFLLLVVR